jgi:tRNA threonylcarbamoyladenosine biosynthesis protein TsaB
MAEYSLALEGSTYAGSVALIRDRDVVAERTLVDSGTPSRGGREERVLPSVAECLDEAGISARDLARVICGAGPGSFTSLRVSASVAKGIAVGAGCPLYAVSSLVLSVSGLESGVYLSVLPAMRDEFFCLQAEVRGPGNVVAATTPLILGSADLGNLAHKLDARVVGPAQEIEAVPHARNAARILDAVLDTGPVNIDTWEPDYGRLAEAQVKWEAAHGRPLGAAT